MNKTILALCAATIVGGSGMLEAADTSSISSITAPPPERAREFLKMYNSIGQSIYTAANEADWAASTDVKAENVGRRIGANEVKAKFQGSPYVIAQARSLLEEKEHLDEITVKELESVLVAAASYPGTAPELVSARVMAEARQSAIQDGFRFQYKAPGETDAREMT